MNRFIERWPALLFVVLMWLVYLAIQLSGLIVVEFGVLPRKTAGLLGIVTSPLIHLNLSHLVSNTMPLLILPALAQVSISVRAVYSIMLIGGIGSGFGTWLLSTADVVIGASGIVFTWLGFLCTRAYFTPNLTNIVLSIAVMLIYGGALVSLLTVLPTISWAAHFSGFISGVCIAGYFDRFSSNEAASAANKYK